MSGDRSELARFGLERVPVVERFGDVEFADPYRLLEDESVAVQAWQAHRHARAGAALADIPGMAALARQLEAHLLADRLTAPVAANGRWFWAERDASGAVRSVRVSDAPDAHATRLVAEASVVALDGDEAIEWFAPSPDGCTVALGVGSRGDEQAVLALVAVGTGALVGAPTRNVGAVAWLPDASGLYLALGAGPSHRLPPKRLAFMRPGERAETLDAPPFAAATLLRVQVSPDGRHVAIAADMGSPRVLYVHDRADGSWSPVCPREDGVTFFGTFADGGYVAATDVGGAGMRLVAAPLDALAHPAGWRDLLSGEEAVLRGVAACGDGLLICELVDGAPRLRLLDGDGRPRATAPLPPDRVVSAWDRMRGLDTAGVPAQQADGRVVFTASTCERPAELWCWEPAAGRLERLSPPTADPASPVSASPRPAAPSPPPAPALRAERVVCAAPDGREVPCELLRRADLAADAPAPLLLHAYGGFNAASLPLGYPSALMPWIAAGGVVAFAHVRGDGTFGLGQWRGGRRGEKQRTFDDLLAVADGLVARGTTTPAQLALMGASNGGLLVGAAITQRPELFKAAALLTPMSDMARLGRERFAEAFSAEYGDVRRPQEARWLRGYSPYHRVEPGTAYPAAIVVAGEHDIRTHAWHARKLAAALSDAAGDVPGAAPPVLLRVHPGRGHQTTALSHPALIAEWLGFLMDQVGLPLAASS